MNILIMIIIVLKLWDNNFNSFCSLFYKLHGKYISILKYILKFHLQDFKTRKLFRNDFR